MTRSKKKPERSPDEVLRSTAETAAELYANGASSLAAVAEAMTELGYPKINPLKVRKLLITAGVYQSTQADAVMELHKAGCSIEEIMERLQLSRASVHSYLPYTRVLYSPAGSADASAEADRLRLHRQRKEAVAQLQRSIRQEITEEPAPVQLDFWHLDSEPDAGSVEAEPPELHAARLLAAQAEPALWNAVTVFQNYPFRTASGLLFRYCLKTGQNGEFNRELLIDRREKSKSLSWSSVRYAFEAALYKQGEVLKKPKSLGNVRGASYLFPMFWRFGLITVPDSVADRMQIQQKKAAAERLRERQDTECERSDAEDPL